MKRDNKTNNKDSKSVASSFDPQSIESSWQSKWDESKVYQPNIDTAKRPFYNLMMFPYPSAEGMHVGNMYAFTGADVYGRFMRMQGFDVFEPMGLDGFGIHSENYAIKVGRHPKEQAQISQKNFYRQLHATGNSFDWSRTVETYDPDYYRWTQWVFVQLFKRGLAYRKKAPVNFCPSDKTVLADEQVIDGKCERCGAVVEKRDLEQWFFKITDYADRLLKNLETLDWAEKVKIAQKQWIGKREGTLIKFKVKGSDKEIDVFTTRGDTLYGATFLVLAPEHPISTSIQTKEVQDYIKEVQKRPEHERIAEEKEKAGVFSGLYAINPLNNEEIPVWIADYALMGFGTGALFGDAHDERDVAFARKYGISLKATLITGDKKKDERILNLEECFTGDGMLVESGEFSGLSSKDAREKVAEWLSKHGKGGRKVVYHLRDWLISRQRYWGPPIPMIHCEKCGWQPVPEEQLPVLLPDIEDWKPRSSQSSSGQAISESPLANHPEFYQTNCPNCGGKARRETDVSDTFLDSAWYFFRYICTDVKDRAFDKERVKKWLPVNMYIGGAEHSVLHLLYSRFITMVFKDMGLISFEEPFTRFYAHGLLIKEGTKMSKSKGNVVIPDEYIKKYGADTLRSYLMFAGPYNMGGDFRDTGIEGMHRFLRRVWIFVVSKQFSDSSAISTDLASLVGKITQDMTYLRYNTAIAKLMMYYNSLSKKKEVTKEEVRVYLKMLAPFAPHMTEELWQRMGEEYSIHSKPWPKVKKAKEEDTLAINIQVNGKFRGVIQVQKNQSEEEVVQEAKKSENIARHLQGKTIKKVIYIPQKALNFVVS